MRVKKAVFLLVLIVFSLLYYGGVFTKTETLPISRDFFSYETPSLRGRPWDANKGSSLGQKEIEELYQWTLDQGTRNFPALSFFLIREAQRAREQGNGDQAVEFARYAARISPDLPQPYVELARSLWYQKPFQFGQMIPVLTDAIGNRFRNFPSSLSFFYNLFYIISNALLMAFIVFGLVILAKYLPLYFYEVRRNLTQEPISLLTNGIKLFVLLLPFLLRLDILWALLFWCILLWGYVTRRERQFILVFLIVLVYVPFFLRSSSAFLNGPSADVVMDLYRANHEEGDGAAEQKLKTWLSKRPDDEDVLLTLGLMEKRQGHFSQAEEYALKATQRSPQFAEAFSNLGNVYLGRKRPGEAVQAYEQAVRLNPEVGAYFYNLFRGYSQETFLSKKSDAAFKKARQLDPELVDYYTAIDSPNLNRFVVDATLSQSHLWKRLLNEYIGREGVLFRLFQAWFETIPSRVSILVPILFLGYLIGMSKYGRAKRFLTRCPMCGSPAYRFYMGGQEEEFICFNCHRIYVQKEKLHPTMTEKKSKQVQAFQKETLWTGRFLSFFVSGLGDLWRGNPVKGLLFIFLFFAVILRLIYVQGVISLSEFYPASTSWKIVLWGLILLLFYLFYLRRVYRFKPKYEANKDGAAKHLTKKT
jgi:tetratricopeptide (TPR) repeat protein